VAAGRRVEAGDCRASLAMTWRCGKRWKTWAFWAREEAQTGAEEPKLRRRTLFGKGRRMTLDLSHCLAVVNFLAANGALVEFQVRDGVRPPVRFAGPVASHFLDLGTTAGGTGSDS